VILVFFVVRCYRWKVCLCDGLLCVATEHHRAVHDGSGTLCSDCVQGVEWCVLCIQTARTVNFQLGSRFTHQLSTR